MKTGIHPDYKECSVQCACGNKFQTRSVKDEIRIEICGACHPYYTGTQKLVDTAGRVDKFNKKYLKDLRQRMRNRVNITLMIKRILKLL